MVDGVSFDQIQEVPVTRISTGFRELDLVFGENPLYDATGRVIGASAGPARGKIGLLCGEPGVGKTKYYTAQAIVWTEQMGLKVGIFQGEMTAGEYKELYMSINRANGFVPKNLANFHVFKSRKHEDHCTAISDLGLDVFIWDSFPYLYKTKTEVDIDNLVENVKNACVGKCVAWMVAHLNEKGKIKGNNRMQYAVDATYLMKKETILGDGVFSIESEKQRQGKPNKAYCRHEGPRICHIESKYLIVDKRQKNF